MENSTPSHLTILIVDDHHIIRRTLKQWLSGKYADVEIIEASSGEDALDVLDEHSVDLTLMDIHLPGIDGIEATRQIKEMHQDVRVIMLTVQEMERYQTNALESGADGYVIKRQMYTDLIPVISSVLKSDS